MGHNLCRYVAVGRLKLDDALKQLAEAEARRHAEAAAKAEAAAAKAEAAAANGGAEGAEGSGQEEGAEGGSGAEGGEGGSGSGSGSEDSAVENVMLGWSDARVKAWNGRVKNENAYYYRFNAPGEAQGNKGWSPKVGLYKLISVYPYSLKPPGFNPQSL